MPQALAQALRSEPRNLADEIRSAAKFAFLSFSLGKPLKNGLFATEIHNVRRTHADYIRRWKSPTMALSLRPLLELRVLACRAEGRGGPRPN
jgi:hypothetical protein